MVAATIEERQEQAVAAEAALTAEVEDMEFRLRALSFDAIGDAKARARLAQLEDDLSSRRRMLALAGVAIAEGERRLHLQAEEREAGKQAEWVAERARLAEARDQLFEEIEQHTATLAALVMQAIADDGDLHNAERRVDAPQSRRAVEILGAYLGNRLTRAGLKLGEGMLHEAYGRPISARRQADERLAAEAAQRAADEARRIAEEAARQQAEEEDARERQEAAQAAEQVEGA